MDPWTPLPKLARFARWLPVCPSKTSLWVDMYGESRNGKTNNSNINMEGQRSNTGDEGETSESLGVLDCTIRSGDLDNEKT